MRTHLLIKIGVLRTLRRRLIHWDPRDFDDVDEWLVEWSKCRRDRPDFTSDAIYLLPLSIAVLRSSRQLERLTFVLAALTAILAALTSVLIFKT
jgi:hypothetical protein